MEKLKPGTIIANGRYDAFRGPQVPDLSVVLEDKIFLEKLAEEIGAISKIDNRLFIAERNLRNLNRGDGIGAANFKYAGNGHLYQLNHFVISLSPKEQAKLKTGKEIFEELTRLNRIFYEQIPSLKALYAPAVSSCSNGLCPEVDVDKLMQDLGRQMKYFKAVDSFAKLAREGRL
ncbi:hypothetical protein KY308_02445 [Candidatus Woesearchaeota archaeon]|nr:hypothetical protein [Candidatus Woesearchaeota archaeon]